MTTNSLAFRLFATAAAWTCWCCRSRAPSSTRSTATRSRPASTGASACCSPSSSSDSMDHGDDRARRRPRTSASRCSRSRIRAGTGRSSRSTQAGPPARLRARSPASTIPLPSEHNVEPNEREVRWANLDGPLRAELRVVETIYVFGEGKKAQRYSVAVAGTLGEVETSLSQLPHPADAGAGAGRPRPPRRHAVPGPLRPAAAAQDRAGPGRHPLGRGDAPRRRAARRDRAAAAGAQRADQVQPGDRRARAHAGRQSRACAEDAARRHHQRGARGCDARWRARSPSRPRSCPTRSISTSTAPAWRRASASSAASPRSARSANRSSARWSASTATSSSPSRWTARPAPASRASGRTWRRCSATCSTTPASGRARKVVLAATPLPHGRQRRTGNWLEIRVDDDGPGLTAEQMAEPIIARPPPRRDQARLRPRPLHRRRPRPFLQRQARARPLRARRPRRPGSRCPLAT